MNAHDSERIKGLLEELGLGEAASPGDPDVDVAFGPGTISHLGDWLGAGGEGVARGAFGTGAERAFAAKLPVRRERRFQAWVQVSMGCNSVCSYCIGCSTS